MCGHTSKNATNTQSRHHHEAERTPQKLRGASLVRGIRTWASRLGCRIYSNAKTCFQSFFMLMTNQPSLFASSYRVCVNVPTLVSGSPMRGP